MYVLVNVFDTILSTLVFGNLYRRCVCSPSCVGLSQEYSSSIIVDGKEVILHIW